MFLFPATSWYAAIGAVGLLSLFILQMIYQRAKGNAVQASLSTVRSLDESRVADVFDLLAWEIELAGARCIMLDSLIGEVMSSLPPNERHKLQRGMHSVDLLAQHLTGLSAFARRLSLDVGPENTAPAAGAVADVSLGALADRMRSALGGQEQGLGDRDEAGEVDLF